MIKKYLYPGLSLLGAAGSVALILYFYDQLLTAERAELAARVEARDIRKEALEREQALQKISRHFGCDHEATPAEIARSIRHHQWTTAEGLRSQEATNVREMKRDVETNRGPAPQAKED